MLDSVVNERSDGIWLDRWASGMIQIVFITFVIEHTFIMRRWRNLGMLIVRLLMLMVILHMHHHIMWKGKYK